MERTTIPSLELKILQVLWNKKNKGSVQDIIDSWPETPVPGYTTILKKLQIMEGKGLVIHEKIGRAYIYIASIMKEEVSKSKIDNMLSTLFLGNKLDMIGAFFTDTAITKTELSRIKEMVNKWEVNDD